MKNHIPEVNVMKKTFLVLTVCVTLLAISALAHAASLSNIYDFRDQVDPETTSFEGLAFTNDGTLWISSAPNFGVVRLLAADLASNTILSSTDYDPQPDFLNLLNPVGLGSDGTNLFVGSNRKWVSGDPPDYVYRNVNPLTGQVSNPAILGIDACVEIEGTAYLNELIYVSCEDTQNVVGIDPATGAVVETIPFGVNLLGLGATEDSLIIGTYEGANRSLLLYNVATTATETIDLADLFVGTGSDYFQLTGEIYEVEVDPGDIRHIPDPDGIAYRDGRIYLAFDHDPRIFEISFGEVPEPTTLLLIGTGLLGIAGLRKKRST